MRLAVFATHPIQYQAPWFRALAAEPGLDVHVYYAMLPDAAEQGAGFGIEFEWDVPLLDGYSWELLDNTASVPSVAQFRGCNVPDLAGAVSLWRPRAALITGWNSLFLLQALLACRRLRIPTLVRGESNVLAPRGAVKKWAQGLLLRRYSVFLAIGQLNRRLYQVAGIADSRIFDCPYFVDNERFARQADALRPRRLELRQKWSIPEQSVCFVFVGKFVPKKRLFDFLAAVDHATKQGVAISALLVGTGEQMDEARAFVASSGTPARFAGFLNQNEVAAAYVASDCLVLPSDHGETWGLVVNEAMACGTPVIVSDQVGCAPDLVSQGETGVVYPMGNVRRLADMMVSLARDRFLRQRMGEAAYQRVISFHSVDKAVAGVITAVDFVACRSSTPTIARQ